MATVNLGRIKPVFRGAYNNSTAYVIDDIVTSGNETFIAIAATQGNATSDASKWTKLAAKGADGADGTDVAATLANKEISFKTNAGALDGIPIGNAGEFLKVNSGATGYEFGAVSSDFVKVASTEVSSSVSSVTMKGFASSDYASYQCIITDLQKTGTTNTNWAFRWHINNSDVTSTNYRTSHHGVYFSNSGSATHHLSGAWDTNQLELTGWNSPDTRNNGYYAKYYRIELGNLSNASLNKQINFEHGNPHPAMNYSNVDVGFGYHSGSETRIAFGTNDGFTIFPNADAIGIAKIKIYGRKA